MAEERPTIVAHLSGSTTPGDPIRYIAGQLIARATDSDDLDLGGLAVSLGMIANDIDTQVQRLHAELAELRTAWFGVRELLIRNAHAWAALNLMDGHDRAAIARRAHRPTSKEG